MTRDFYLFQRDDWSARLTQIVSWYFVIVVGVTLLFALHWAITPLVTCDQDFVEVVLLGDHIFPVSQVHVVCLSSVFDNIIDVFDGGDDDDTPDAITPSNAVQDDSPASVLDSND